MKNGLKEWNFQLEEGELSRASPITIRGVLNKLNENLKKDDQRPVVPLCHGDPSRFPCFRTAVATEDAIVDAVRSAKFNSYAPPNGLLLARRFFYLICFELVKSQKPPHLCKLTVILVRFIY